MTDLWAEGRKLRTVEKGQRFHAWYKPLGHAPMDTSRIIPDWILEHAPVAAENGYLEHGMIRFTCSLSPDQGALTLGQLETLIPGRVVIRRKRGGVSHGRAGEEPEAGEDVFSYELRALDLLVDGPSFGRILQDLGRED